MTIKLQFYINGDNDDVKDDDDDDDDSGSWK